MRINRHDTNGTKPLLGTGELGYDNYPTGGDSGRVYVGTGTANIPLAKKNENTTGNAATATKLATARTINGVSFDGTTNIVAPTNLGITADTTAGPIVTSSTGTNATLPTASATASGVVTTGVQTWAGEKTFSSNPISSATQSTATNALTRKDYVDTKVDKVPSTDNAIVRFNGTTGDVQNSSVIIDDNGNINCKASADSAAIKILGRDLDNTSGIYFYNSNGSEALGTVVKNMTNGLNRMVIDSSGTDSFFEIRLNNQLKAKVDPSGNLLLTSGTGGIGYDTGAGGTVTQLTSKSTAVTLNKPSGRIIMCDAELAAGAPIAFTLNNNLLNIGDTVVITSTTWGAYNIRVGVVTTGIATIYVTNIASTPQSQTVPIVFSIIKGAIA